MKLQAPGRTLALLAASTLALSACGGGEETTPDAGATSSGGASSAPALTGTLNGGGASSQQAAMDAWVSGIGAANEGLTVNYDAAGSSAGREQFLKGGLAFAGSDAALDEEEIAAGKKRCTGGDAINLPLYISPVAVIYNLAGVEELSLSPAVIAKIFNQKIKTWNDPAIADLNKGTELPSTAITPVNRSDGSGTTENFTDYLAQAAKADWPYEADSDFPVKGGEGAQGTSGVVEAVTAGDGAIGYADFSRAGDLGVAKVQVGQEFVAPSAEGASALVGAAERETGRAAGDISLTLPRTGTDPAQYPITLVTYSIVCTSYQDAATANNVKGFFTYVASPEGQAAAEGEAGSAPIPDTIATDVQTALDSIKSAA